MVVAPIVPAVKSGARIRPKTAMEAVTHSKVRRRPCSASTALIGMKAAKKRMPISWMSRNLSRL